MSDNTDTPSKSSSTDPPRTSRPSTAFTITRTPGSIALKILPTENHDLSTEEHRCRRTSLMLWREVGHKRKVFTLLNFDKMRSLPVTATSLKTDRS